MSKGRFSRALHQKLSPESSPQLVPQAGKMHWGWVWTFSPKKYPFLVYDLIVSKEGYNGLAVSFALSETKTDFQKLDETFDTDVEHQRKMDPINWDTSTLNFGDMTIVQDCYSAVLKALHEVIEETKEDTYWEFILFKSVPWDKSRVRFYNTFARVVKQTFWMDGPIKQYNDGDYEVWKVYFQEPEEEFDGVEYENRAEGY